MKILFAGGGTGGHFYPIIAIAEQIYERSREKKIVTPKLYFMAPSKYNPRALFDNEIEFVQVPAGKIRRYFSILNFFDLFVTAYGILVAILKMYRIYPDVVVGKGGYASFPALVAARILRIPVVIHESDSVPGRVNAWAGKFAARIALSYPDAAEYFSKKGDPSRIAFTGLPIRKDIREPLSNGAREFLQLEEETPTIVFVGGSQGSQRINDVVIDMLPEMTEKYQVIHQTGRNNFELVKNTSEVVLKDNPKRYRYHPFDYLNDLSMRMSAGVADVVVSRAGSAIFEIASWGVPSIIIPLPKEISHDQTENAFAYSRTGACSVIEEHNLGAHILLSEIDKIVNNTSIADRMRQSAKQFSHPDAATKIADVLLEIGLEHE
jgi:UDP-N-acetylglucosamine--N-acetylmuramyl-(pentapeptide) pyrophosphoryl-undecaprenol N-acetylglucosamine transferase